MPSRRATMIVLFLSFFAFTNIGLSENSANRFLQKSTFVRRADASLPMRSMHFAFKLRNEPELQRLLAEQQDPISPNYHKWITPEEFGQRFGVAENTYAAAVHWLEGNGFSVTQQYPNRLSIYFDGTADQAERAFGVRMGIYQLEGKEYYSNDRLPQVPTEFQEVALDIFNLDNFPKEKPLFSSGGSPSMGPRDMWTAYNFLPLYNRGINGAGQSIAIVATSDFNINDVRQFRNTFGLAPNDPLKILAGTNPGFGGGEGEALLDIEWAGAMAPNATIRAVISSDLVMAINFIVHSLTSTHVINISFGRGESFSMPSERDFLNGIFMQASTQGQTVLVSSGDQGAEQGNGLGAFTDNTQDINVCAVPLLLHASEERTSTLILIQVETSFPTSERRLGAAISQGARI